MELRIIYVGNNVFIGSDTVILPGVKIGDNNIIGAGTVVTKDLPTGNIWGGVPARRIGSFKEFVNKRRMNVHPETDAARLWEMFYKARENINVSVKE